MNKQEIDYSVIAKPIHQAVSQLSKRFKSKGSSLDVLFLTKYGKRYANFMRKKIGVAALVENISSVCPEFDENFEQFLSAWAEQAAEQIKKDGGMSDEE